MSGAARDSNRPGNLLRLTADVTRVSSRVHGCTEQQQVLGERRVQQTHGAHPAPGVHKHPLQVLVWQDVAGVPGQVSRERFRGGGVTNPGSQSQRRS